MCTLTFTIVVRKLREANPGQSSLLLSVFTDVWLAPCLDFGLNVYTSCSAHTAPKKWVIAGGEEQITAKWKQTPIVRFMGWTRVCSQNKNTALDNASTVWLHGTTLTRIVSFPAPVLGPVINIRTSWRGFPPAVTAAVSVPTTAEPEGYRYFVFSGRKSHTPHCLQSWNKSMRFGSVWSSSGVYARLCCSTSEAQNVLHVSVGMSLTRTTCVCVC